MRALRIAIAGAGTAGLAAAAFLTRDGHDVQLFERFDEPRASIGAGLMLQPTGLASPSVPRPRPRRHRRRRGGAPASTAGPCAAPASSTSPIAELGPTPLRARHPSRRPVRPAATTKCAASPCRSRPRPPSCSASRCRRRPPACCIDAPRKPSTAPSTSSSTPPGMRSPAAGRRHPESASTAPIPMAPCGASPRCPTDWPYRGPAGAGLRRLPPDGRHPARRPPPGRPAPASRPCSGACAVQRSSRRGAPPASMRWRAQRAGGLASLRQPFVAQIRIPPAT